MQRQCIHVLVKPVGMKYCSFYAVRSVWSNCLPVLFVCSVLEEDMPCLLVDLIAGCTCVCVCVCICLLLPSNQRVYRLIDQ